METTEGIGYFRVTRRSFEKVIQALDTTPEAFLKELPQKAVVVEIGSGLGQSFSREIQKQRPDVKVVSLDPTLALDSNFFTTHKISSNGTLQQVSYKYFNGQRPKLADTPEQQEKIRRQRLESASKTGKVIAGIAPELPFANNSVDMLVDSWGPGMYLDQEGTEYPLKTYLSNIARVLKKEGIAYIYPIDSYNEALETLRVRNANAKRRYENFLSSLPGIEFKFYQKEDPGLSNKKSKTRIGVKIRKK